MGHYSVLSIGKHIFQWKYDIPGYLSFLFEEDHAYSEISEEDEGYPIKIGFRTSAVSAIQKLDQLGMDWNMVIIIYSFFYKQLKEAVADSIESEIIENNKDKKEKIVQAKIRSAMAQFHRFSRQQELEDFVNFFMPMIDASLGVKNMSVKSIDGKRYKIPKDPCPDSFNSFLYDPSQFFYEKTTLLPPWIQIIGNLFDHDLLQEYTEVVSLVQIRLLLEASSPDTVVDLQLEDIIEDKEEIADFHLTSAQRVIDKINLYNQFFHTVLNQEAVIKDVYFREKLLGLLDKIPKSKTIVEKGRGLEDLIDVIFSSVIGLEVIEKRISTKDEEIDLVVKNSINGTFWSSLMSPCFFVECKNWKSKVGSSEIRDFEVKIANHRKLVKIGFFVSFNGFTKEVYAALKRASREEYHIVLIDRSDIDRLAKSGIATIPWLEALITKLH